MAPEPLRSCGSGAIPCWLSESPLLETEGAEVGWKRAVKAVEKEGSKGKRKKKKEAETETEKKNSSGAGDVARPQILTHKRFPLAGLVPPLPPHRSCQIMQPDACLADSMSDGMALHCNSGG